MGHPADDFIFGSGLPGHVSPENERRLGWVTKDGQESRLADLLVKNFGSYVAAYEQNPPFRRYGQLEFHRETIDRRFELGSAIAAVNDDRFLNSLYKTLQKWGIGSRASKLRPLKDFCSVLQNEQRSFEQLENRAIDDLSIDGARVGDELWQLMTRLPVVENEASLVAVTKTLHHVLPDLVVPMDREYTQTFFGWANPTFQYRQQGCFLEAFGVFVRVARNAHPTQYVRSGWNSSRTKVIDNAIVGLVQTVKAHVRAQSASL